MNVTALPDTEAVARNRSDIEQHLKLLPLLPAVVTRLLALNPGDDDYMDEVYKLARQDPTLSVRLVEYATRTIAYEPAKDRLELRHAMARLGTRKIAGLITTLSMLSAFDPRTQSDRDLWIHSVEVAVIVRHLATMMPDLRFMPEQLYLSGLLHDIGRFIVFQSVPEAPAIVDEANWGDPDGLIGAELDVLGFSHEDVGALACRQWGMPDSITEIVASHHRKDLPRETLEEQQLLKRICLIQIADACSMSLMRHSAGGDSFDAWSDIPRLEEEIQGLIDRFVDVYFGQFPLKYRMILPRQLARKIDQIVMETRAILTGLGIECPSLFSQSRQDDKSAALSH